MQEELLACIEDFKPDLIKIMEGELCSERQEP
jgi:hypothetical protein